MPIRILVNGARGKMGQETVKAIQACNDLSLVATTGRQDDLQQAIKASQAQVVVDFTTAAAAFANTQTIINAGARPVIGTTGISKEQLNELAQQCKTAKLGAMIVPNFSIGAILMMRYARECARYFPHVEIIELHHQNKADAPSGTAMLTAELIAETRASVSPNPHAKEILPGARGASYQDIPIHSVRLPGLVAHQMVIFGDVGQTLTIRDDTTSREAFMPGVCLACRKVMTLDSLIYGLEPIL